MQKQASSFFDRDQTIFIESEVYLEPHRYWRSYKVWRTYRCASLRRTYYSQRVRSSTHKAFSLDLRHPETTISHTVYTCRRLLGNIATSASTVLALLHYSLVVVNHLLNPLYSPTPWSRYSRSKERKPHHQNVCSQYPPTRPTTTSHPVNQYHICHEARAPTSRSHQPIPVLMQAVPHLHHRLPGA